MWTLTEHKGWDYLKKNFSWVANMHDVPQDKVAALFGTTHLICFKHQSSTYHLSSL